MATLNGQSEFSSKNLVISSYLVYEGNSTLYFEYQKLLSPFQSCFGENSYQDINYFYINKADFIPLKLQSNSRAESILIALLLNIEFYFKNDERFNVEIEYWKKQFIKINNVNYIMNTFILNLYAKLDYEYGVAIKQDSQLLTPKNF